MCAVFFVTARVAFRGWQFAKYPRLAEALHSGAATADQIGDASPAYLFINVLLSPEVLHVIQSLAAALTVSVLFLGLRKSHGLIAAWTAAVVLATSRNWLVYSAVLEPDLLIGCCNALGVVLLSNAVRRRTYLGAGLALGLAIALRPTAALFGLFAVGYAALARPRSNTAVLGVAMLVAAALPTVLLRATAGHDARATMSIGQVFHQSHRPEATGVGATFPSIIKIVEVEEATRPHPPDHAHELYRELARAGHPEVVTSFDAELFWFRKALSFFRHHPGELLVDVWKKTLNFVTLPGNEYDIPSLRAALDRPLGTPIGWLLFAVAGMALVGLAAGPRTLGLWVASYASSYVVAVLFYFHGRYATGLIPTGCAVIGIGLQEVLTRRRRLAPLALAPLLLTLSDGFTWTRAMTDRLAVIEDWATAPPRSREEARRRYVSEQAGFPDVFWPTAPHGFGLDADSPAIAREAAAEATRRWGIASPPHATLVAALWAQAGDCDKALDTLQGSLSSSFVWAVADRTISPRLVASDCLVSLGRHADAYALLIEENTLHPGRLDTLARLVAAGDTGTGTDVERWERELFELHDAASAHLVLAKVRRRWGDPVGALEDADRLRALWPAATGFAEHERALALLNQPGASAIDAWTKALTVHAALHEQDRFDDLARSIERSAGPTPDTRRHWQKRVGEPRQ